MSEQAQAAGAPPTVPDAQPELLQLGAALLAGVVFGVGLALAQMTDPNKVLAFLDVTGGAWDASLLFVLGGAAGLSLATFWWLRTRSAPLFDVRFHFPTLTLIDRRLVLGSILFGIGWGLAGYCPGPAIASIGLANGELWWFLPSLVLGAWWARRAAK